MPLLILVMLLSGIASGGIAAEEPSPVPIITKPWARATAPKAPTGAVYAAIAEPAGKTDRLTSATCDVAESVELHTHERSATGVLRMVKVDAMDISTDHPLTLAPGSSHLMLMGLKRALIEGEQITVTLTFTSAGTVTVHVPIGNAGAMGPDEAAVTPNAAPPDCCHQPPAVGK